MAVPEWGLLGHHIDPVLSGNSVPLQRVCAMEISLADAVEQWTVDPNVGGPDGFEPRKQWPITDRRALGERHQMLHASDTISRQ